MGRQSAAGASFLSASLRFTVADDAAPVDDRFRFWHGPQNRWRIESNDEVVYVRGPDATVLRGSDGQMRRQVADIVLPLLGQVNPLDLLGSESMLMKMSQDAYIGPASSVLVDGRPGWSVPIGTSDSDAMTVVLDDETGMTLRMESAGQIAVAAASDISVHDELADSVFTWDGTLADTDDRSHRGDRDADRHRARLDILTAIHRALDRRDEVFEVIARSAEPSEAADAVSRLLDVERTSAEAVLALQLRRFSTSERAKVSTELDEMRRDPPPAD
ncbi:DNA gyrase/topoisomerase IV, subunit A [Williamsia maris]|uniref:DNA gyrase/topoisomerase IV, subunit A n=2 Tax=Williamsia maris TaxID=72806 RepID=A0ABT1HDV4_9NOCA|nr:DNA gyrase/topoisomerase IV, subunit A [Williamsia maris]